MSLVGCINQQVLFKGLLEYRHWSHPRASLTPHFYFLPSLPPLFIPTPPTASTSYPLESSSTALVSRTLSYSPPTSTQTVSGGAIWREEKCGELVWEVWEDGLEALYGLN